MMDGRNQERALIADTRPLSRQIFMRLRQRGLIASGLSSSSAGAFLVLSGGAGVSYVAQVVTARIVGMESFGFYMYAIAWMVVASSLSTLGLHVSLVRLVPAYRALGDWAATRGVISFTAWRVAIAGLLISACGIVVTLGADLNTELKTTILIALAASPLVAMQLVGAALVRTFGGVVAALAPERLGRPSIAVAVLAGLVALGIAPATAPTAILAMMASAFAILVITFILAWSRRPAELEGVGPRTATRDWMRPAIPLTIMMGADVVMARSGVVVLGLQDNARGAGIFAVAVSLSILPALPRMAVAAAFAPTVASLHAVGDRAAMQALIARAARLTLVGTVSVTVPLLLALPILLSFFGPGFSEGVPATAILLCGQVLSAAAGPQQHLVTMTGRESAGAAMQASGALVGLLLCFALTKPFGIVGTAVAVTVGLVVWNVVMAWFVFSNLGIRPGLLASRHFEGI